MHELMKMRPLASSCFFALALLCMCEAARLVRRSVGVGWPVCLSNHALDLRSCRMQSNLPAVSCDSGEDCYALDGTKFGEMRERASAHTQVCVKI